MQGASIDQANHTSIRRRNRRVNTCLECQRLKRRCSRTHPCSNCTKTMRECVFPVSSPGESSGSRTNSTSLATPHSQESVSYQSTPSLLERPNLLIGPNSRRLPDMCLQIGKLSITERIGGITREHIVPWLENFLQQRQFNLDDQFSAPLIAWFKPHHSLPWAQLMSDIPNAMDDAELVSFPKMQEQILFDQFVTAVYPVCPLALPHDAEGDDDLSTALRLAMFYAAVASMTILETQRLLGMAKISLIKELKVASEHAFAAIAIFACFEQKLFQAILIYLTPQFLAEVPRSHSIFLAAITRHFQIAGLDKDSEYDSIAQSASKRRLWHHLLFLNIRSTEAVGPEHALVDDVKAKLPQHNESTLALLRYDCYRLHGRIFRERCNMKQGRTTYLAVLQMVERSRVEIEQSYLTTLDDTVPIQRYARVVGNLLLARAEGMILQTQWQDGSNLASPMEMKQRSIRACLEVLEAAVMLETDPALAQWAWYSGAYQQYHSIIYPLTQVYLNPDIPDAERIITMADHVFGPSTTILYDERSANILQALKNNMASFLSAIKPSTKVPYDADRQELHEHISVTSPTNALDNFPLGTFGAAPGSRDNFELFAGLGTDDFSTGDGDDFWMSWPPAQIYPQN